MIHDSVDDEPGDERSNDRILMRIGGCLGRKSSWAKSGRIYLRGSDIGGPRLD